MRSGIGPLWVDSRTIGAAEIAGMGWALGVGRLGGIAGPWVGGYLLAQGLPPRQIFLVTCVTAGLATMTMIALGVRGRRQARAVLREA